MFVSFHFTKPMWIFISKIYNISTLWEGISIVDCFLNWNAQNSKWKTLACFLCWQIDKVRDKIIFKDSQIDFILSGYIGLDSLKEYLAIQDFP